MVHSSCSGLRQVLSRRGFLQIGPVGLLTAGLLHTLDQRARATLESAGVSRGGTAQACIILFQVGGPYQCDSFDPKPLAPEEVRGPFRSASTTVPGMQLTEAFPLVARLAHRFAIVRSVHHTIRCHNPAIYCALAGREATDSLAISRGTEARRTDHPNYASVLARLRPGLPSMPHHVIIPDVVAHGQYRTPGLHGGYLGARYDPFIVGGDPASPTFAVEGTDLPVGVDRTRFQGRQSLLQQLDDQRRSLDRSPAVANVDTYYRRAFDLLTSARTRQAFELHQEPARLRDQYGRHTVGQGALLARRLVESGVPFVTVFSHTRVEQQDQNWDTHNRHYELSRRHLLPPADQSLAALLEDLSQRGLLATTLVVWMGEFGRTPRMGVRTTDNPLGADGRDHWCNCYSVVLAGGGIQGGRVIGSSDGIGAYPREQPVHINDLAATIYYALGVEPRAQLHDIQGQLRYICDGNPVLELF
jgi:Protein of unknown function (DUF1501)